MSCVSAVEGEWLAEAGPMFFSVKESFETTLQRRQQQRQDLAKMEAEMQQQQAADEAAAESSLQERLSARRSQAVATAGRRTTGATPRFMPRKKGRLGL